MNNSMPEKAASDVSTATHIDRLASVSMLSDEDLGGLMAEAAAELAGRARVAHLYWTKKGVTVWPSLCGRAVTKPFKPSRTKKATDQDARPDCKECLAAQVEGMVEDVNPRPTERPSWADPAQDQTRRAESLHWSDRGVAYHRVVGEREVREGGYSDPERARTWMLSVAISGFRHDQGAHFDFPDEVVVNFDSGTGVGDSLQDVDDIRWLAETLDAAATLMERERRRRS